MDFSFSAEQDDLRREARAFLEANPAPTLDAARRARLGRDPAERGLHVPRRGGAVRGARPRALRRAVRAERGRRQPATRSGRSRSTGSSAPRGRPRAPPGMQAATAQGEPVATMDETLGSASSPNGRSRAGDWETCGGCSRARARGGRHRREGARARDRVRERARAVRQEDRRLPGDLALARRRLRRGRARPVARLLGGLVCRRGRRRRPTSRSRRRSRRRPRRPCSRARSRSRRSAASASPGSTCCTATTSARSGSRARSATAASTAREVAESLLSS